MPGGPGVDNMTNVTSRSDDDDKVSQGTHVNNPKLCLISFVSIIGVIVTVHVMESFRGRV